MKYERSKPCYVESGGYVCVGMKIGNIKYTEFVTKIRLTILSSPHLHHMSYKYVRYRHKLKDVYMGSGVRKKVNRSLWGRS